MPQNYRKSVFMLHSNVRVVLAALLACILLRFTDVCWCFCHHRTETRAPCSKYDSDMVFVVDIRTLPDFRFSLTNSTAMFKHMQAFDSVMDKNTIFHYYTLCIVWLWVKWFSIDDRVKYVQIFVFVCQILFFEKQSVCEDFLWVSDETLNIQCKSVKSHPDRQSAHLILICYIYIVV